MTDFNDQFLMTIGGKPVSAGSQLEAFNPATKEVIASFPDASREQLEEGSRLTGCSHVMESTIVAIVTEVRIEPPEALDISPGGAVAVVQARARNDRRQLRREVVVARASGAVVAKQPVLSEQVHDVQIEILVIVYVAPDGSESVITLDADPGLRSAHVVEGPVASISIQQAFRRREAFGATHHRESHEKAIGCTARRRCLFSIELDVVCDEQVVESVSVEIGECRTRAPP